MLNELSRELAARDVDIVGVNFDDDPRERTLKIAAGLGIEFHTLTSQELARLKLSAPHVMPTTYVVSPGNETVATLVGLQTRAQILDQLLRLGVLNEAP